MRRCLHLLVDLLARRQAGLLHLLLLLLLLLLQLIHELLVLVLNISAKLILGLHIQPVSHLDLLLQISRIRLHLCRNQLVLCPNLGILLFSDDACFKRLLQPRYDIFPRR